MLEPPAADPDSCGDDQFLCRGDQTCIPIVSLKDSISIIGVLGNEWFKQIRKIQCHYNFLQNKVCDFVEDCTDFSDEATCPDKFEFDNCLDNWGDNMCWWKEEPVDQLDWIIAYGKNEDNLSFFLVLSFQNYL